jgi:uncharacterized protein (TIGR02246 family)
MSSERQSDKDEEAIRELLDRQVTGWDAGDAEAYASVFTPDADYVTFLGSHYTGRDAIAASYVPLFTKLLKGSRLHTDHPAALADARRGADPRESRRGEERTAGDST